MRTWREIYLQVKCFVSRFNCFLLVVTRHLNVDTCCQIPCRVMKAQRGMQLPRISCLTSGKNQEVQLLKIVTKHDSIGSSLLDVTQNDHESWKSTSQQSNLYLKLRKDCATCWAKELLRCEDEEGVRIGDGERMPVRCRQELKNRFYSTILLVTAGACFTIFKQVSNIWTMWPNPKVPYSITDL